MFGGIAGIERVNVIINDLPKKYRGATAIVGYTAAYALWVHESIGMVLAGKPRPKGRGNYWDPQGRGQAKFLEQPARTEGKTIARIVREAILAGVSVPQALMMGAMHLQRESMKLVPVDTGNLKNSAFSRLE